MADNTQSSTIEEAKVSRADLKSRDLSKRIDEAKARKKKAIASKKIKPNTLNKRFDSDMNA